jgi:hypothetical protein
LQEQNADGPIPKQVRRKLMRMLNDLEVLGVVAADGNGGNEGSDIYGPVNAGPTVGFGGLFPLVPILPDIHYLPIG